MRERKRETVRDLRRDNRSVLLSSLYFDQPRSRHDLSKNHAACVLQTRRALKYVRAD